MIGYKKILSLILVFATCFCIMPISVSAESEVSNVQASDHAFNEDKIVFTFANLSDPHVGFGDNANILRNTLETVKKYAPDGIDAVLFNGDQTQDGTKEQAELFTSIVKESFDVSQVPVILTHGNHDVYWSGCMTRAQFVDAYGLDMYQFDQDMTSIYKGNRHVEINGYHFVSVDIETYMPNYNTLSSDTEDWLKGTLDRIVASDPNSYVFVSCHSPAKDTVYGSMSDDVKNTGNWGASAELHSILKDYPQVILFSGHTHYGINLETNINQTTYTQINSGSSSDIDFDITSLEARRSYSQGMIVDVDEDNNIRITRIDLKKDMVIKEPWYIDAYKADGSSLSRYSKETRLASNSAPVFPNGVEVVEVSSNEIRVDFDSAVDDDMVFYYVIEVKNESGATIASKTIVTPFYDDPTLQNMPGSYSASFTGSFKYPYTVNVKAYDCYYVYTEFSKKMVDMTEENSIIASEFDAKIDHLLVKELSESDFELIASTRKEINKLGYKVKNLMNKLDDFEELEREYYNRYFITDCSEGFAPSKEDCFSISPLTSKGWIEDSANIGVKMNWKDATANYLMGFNSKFDLEGLHLGFTNLDIKSESQVLGILFSNVYKDKWTSNEALLIKIDFASGNVSTGSGISVGRSDMLVYSNMGSVPFDLKFDMVDEGMTMKISSPLGSDTLTVPSSALEGLSNFTDPSACYLSLSPWATKTTMSLEITAVHTEDTVEEPIDPGAPEDPDSSNDGSEEPQLNFFQRIWQAIVNFFRRLFGIY